MGRMVHLAVGECRYAVLVADCVGHIGLIDFGLLEQLF